MRNWELEFFLLISIAAAFIDYAFPGEQLSYWWATFITNLLPTINDKLYYEYEMNFEFLMPL